MAKYLLVDTMNTFFRARHVVRGDASVKIGMSIHITMNAINKCWRKLGADHVVFGLEGRSWRKDFYEPYKKNRKVARDAMTTAQADEDAAFFEAYDDFLKFIQHKTNCTALQCEIAEADDMIALFIAAHPNDNHIIISSDSDYFQLITDNVTMYDGVQNRIITKDGFFKDDKNMTPIKEKKTGEIKEKVHPEWALFEKCVRGDTSDNIFSAYPGCRKKGTKNKIGMMEAFADKETGGFNWNNFMLQRWTDHNGVEHTVRDDYERNVKLVDLTAQPMDLKVKFIETIAENSIPKSKTGVGMNFLKFCGIHDLQNLAKSPDELASILNNPYPS
jgi:5'-3' exonuclease